MIRPTGRAQWLQNLYRCATKHSSTVHIRSSSVQGVWGFITGGLTWFAIPFCLATTMGMAYVGLSSAQGAPLLTEEDVSKGELKAEGKSRQES